MVKKTRVTCFWDGRNGGRHILNELGMFGDKI